MTELLLDTAQRARLSQLVGRTVRQLVWDLNAIYFVSDGGTLKLAAETRSPPSPESSEFAEAACLAVEADNDVGPFHLIHDDAYWYRVVAEDVVVQGLECVQTGILMPAEQLWPLRDPPPPGNWLTPCDCGILVTTSEGVLPAVQTQNAYGFMNWPFIGLYERTQVMELLAAHQGLYDVQPM